MKITSAKFHDDIKYQGCDCTGFEIETEDGFIRVMIDNFSQCCEDWDISMDPHCNLDTLVGRTVTSIKWEITDNKIKWEDEAIVDLQLDNMETIKIKATNYHNGYYPHSVFVEWPGHPPETQTI